MLRGPSAIRLPSRNTTRHGRVGATGSAYCRAVAVAVAVADTSRPLRALRSRPRRLTTPVCPTLFRIRRVTWVTFVGPHRFADRLNSIAFLGTWSSTGPTGPRCSRSVTERLVGVAVDHARTDAVSSTVKQGSHIRRCGRLTKCAVPPLVGATPKLREPRGQETWPSGPLPSSMNFNLSVFWTLVVVLVGAPLLGLVLYFAALLAAVVLGYDA